MVVIAVGPEMWVCRVGPPAPTAAAVVVALVHCECGGSGRKSCGDTGWRILGSC